MPHSLTERQREFLRLHYDEDMSFSEIGRSFSVSRQALHDAVRHGLNALYRYESALGILTGTRQAAGHGNGQRQARQKLQDLLDTLEGRSEVPSSTDIRGQLREIIDLLADNESTLDR